MREWQSQAHVKYYCRYHVVFVPKYRRKSIYGALRKDIGGIFRELCCQYGVELIEGHAMGDHVHMLLLIPPKHSVSHTIGFLKGKSAIRIFRDYLRAKRNFTGRHFGATGYCVSTVGLDKVMIREYIKSQELEEKRQEQMRLSGVFDSAKTLKAIRTKSVTKLLSITLLCFVLLPAYASDAWQEAESLLEQGKAEATYQILAPMEGEYAGKAAFDSLLARSANQSGHYTEAIFAYERLLTITPGDNEARYQLARIYYRLGETAKAENTYQQLLSSSPEKQIQTSAEKELEAIQKGMLFNPTQISAYLGLTIGHDSNVNGATNDSTLIIPDLGSGSSVSYLPASFQEQSDSFRALLAGITIDHQLSRNLSLYGKGSISTRTHNSQDAFDSDQFAIDFGIKLDHQTNQYLLGYVVSEYRLDGDEYRQLRGAKASWSHVLSRNRAFHVSGFHGQVEYNGQDIKDVDRSTIALGYTVLLSGSLAPRIKAGIYFGEEDNLNSLTPHLGHNLNGVQMVGELTLNGPLKAYTALYHERRDYGGQDPLFLKTRKDHQTTFALGLKYEPAPNWELVPEIRYTNNDSNLSSYEYDRLQANLLLFKHF